MAFVTVKEFNHAHEALLAKSFLEQEGIIAFIKGELTIRTDHFFAQSQGYIKLQVHEKDIDLAIELLKDFKDDSNKTSVSGKITTYKRSEIDIDKCPNCSSTNFTKSKISKGMKLLFLGFTNLPFFKKNRKCYCYDCNYRWKVD